MSPLLSHSITRRDFLAGAAASALLARAALADEPIPANSIGRLGLDSAGIDTDLIEVGIPALRAFYAAKRYTATQVTHWYLDRIAHYNPVYRAVIHVDAAGALATATALDAAAQKGGAAYVRGPLWGVPIVIKANTSVKGLVTSAGWSGYLIPGKELIAPADAHVVAKLRAAGAIILGQTNMPDFAASDTNYSSAFGRTGNAYNVRFSPGGSSGGTVTAVTANFAVFGTGTDTSNSIRMPAGTSDVVGMLPTRGLVSIAGIQPLDWLLDDTGPIARNVTDVAIALGIMAGEDPQDFRTSGSAPLAQPGPYTNYLNTNALKGKRFGVPAFIVPQGNGAGAGGPALEADTRAQFMAALDGLRAAGATVVFDDAILPVSFVGLVGTIKTRPYIGEGTEAFLRDFGPAMYHSPHEYALAVGAPLPATVTGVAASTPAGAPAAAPVHIETDPQAEANFWAPQRAALAAYDDTCAKFQLDGMVYPAIQMPPNDEIQALLDGHRSGGPHSATGWVNPIGVPAIVLPAGFYPSGLPFGLELSGKRWKDGDLLGYAFAYEQATKLRKPPVLVDKTVTPPSRDDR